MNNIEQSLLACRTLVETRPKLQSLNRAYVLFCTVSPNPALKIPCSLKNSAGKQITKKIQYRYLPQRIQLEYCMKHLRTTYMSLLEDITLVGSVEHNKEGNVHLHFVLQSHRIQSDIQLDVFRRDILLCPTTLENISGKGKIKRDFMNNIVRVTKPLTEVLDYMDKCYKNIIHSPYKNYYIEQ